MNAIIKQQGKSVKEGSPGSCLNGEFVVAAWDELRRQLPEEEVRIIQGIYSAQDWARNHLGWLSNR
jgi:hypothetical protein